MVPISGGDQSLFMGTSTSWLGGRQGQKGLSRSGHALGARLGAAT